MNWIASYRTGLWRRTNGCHQRFFVFTNDEDSASWEQLKIMVWTNRPKLAKTWLLERIKKDGPNEVWHLGGRQLYYTPLTFWRTNEPELS
jgi:hypothetical protein